MVASAQATLVSRNFPPTDVDTDTFYHAITSARNHGKEEERQKGTFKTINSKWFGACVHVYPLEEYRDMHRILFDNAGAGFALKNRDIVSVFKHPESTIPALRTMIPVAIQLGGNRLDCFNRGLPSMYSEFGFFPVAKIQFDRAYAPEDWNYVRDREPDIIYMVYKKALANQDPVSSRERDSRIESVISRLSYSTHEEALETQMQSCRIEFNQVP